MSATSQYQQLNLPAISQDVLDIWIKSEAFKKSITLREGNEAFVFYEVLQAPMVCLVFIM